MVFFCFHIHSEHQDAPFCSHACIHLLHLLQFQCLYVSFHYSASSISETILPFAIHTRSFAFNFPLVSISPYHFPLYEVRWVLKLGWCSPCFNVRRCFSTDLLCNLQRAPSLIIVGEFIQMMPGGGCTPITFSSCLSLKSIEFCSTQPAPEFVGWVGYDSQGVSWHLQTETR